MENQKLNKELSKIQEKLKRNPEDVVLSFQIAQLYETLGDDASALKYVEPTLNAMPESFEALSLAARCSSGEKKYDEAYLFSCRALQNPGTAELGKFEKRFFQVLSYIPGLGRLSQMEDFIKSTSSKQEEWLKEYIQWYEQKI